MNRYRFAIIGCGRISYKHVEAIAANKNEGILVCVCDIVEERAVSKAKQYKEKCPPEQLPKVYTDYQEMIEKEQIDIITIATESGYHAEIAVYCMNKGINVICEKPMALSIEDADNMICIAKLNNVKLCICHQNRFNSSIQLLRKAVEKNRFGRLISGTARILWNRDMDYYTQAKWRGTWELDGGALMNQCIHDIDLLQWMLGGQIDTVYAQCDTFLRKIDAEDFGAIIIRFKNGAIGMVEGTTCIYPRNLKETLDIFGEKGTVSIGGIAVNKIDTWSFEDESQDNEFISKFSSKDPDTVYGFGHKFLFKDMINAIRENKTPYVDGEEGKKAMAIVLAAYKSRLTGKEVKFPLEWFSTLDMKGFTGKG
ncbi:Gfo/Idh/MocA family protein [Clostridium manihotivorum]|uniref:Oxidoreductase n=1 Tax=Clostridium manihotivorum TaxID=2320868 RepID=A0A410DNF1_9CLOT|nr:Gfo/Idh/MocA family oxidoreductase [Clostridium manihotivorum]QAA30598.1 oxidoreductase [Clostridium manihotivorum]